MPIPPESIPIFLCSPASPAKVNFPKGPLSLTLSPSLSMANAFAKGWPVSLLVTSKKPSVGLLEMDKCFVTSLSPLPTVTKIN
jgi:hypothetical protein